MHKIPKRILLVVLASLVITGCNNQSNNNSTETQQTTNTENATESIDETETSTQIEISTETEIATETEATTESESTTDSESTTESETPSVPEYTYTDLDKTMYVSSSVNVRALPNKDGTKLGSLAKRDSVHVTGQCNETGWYRIEFNGETAYVSASYLSDTQPEEETSSSNNNQSNNNEYPDHYIFTDKSLATAEELSAYTFTEMDVIMYPTNRMSFWKLPRNDMDFYFDNSNNVGWTLKYVPTRITGICNETGVYRLNVDGYTVFVSGNKGAFGEDAFVSTIPVATKTNPGYTAGTPEWHAYWDGTTMGEYYITTGEDLWMVVKPIVNGVEALAYSGSYPNDYVIGSYAEITVNGFTFKGEY